MIGGGPEPDLAFVRRSLEADSTLAVECRVEEQPGRFYQGKTLSAEVLAAADAVVLVCPGADLVTGAAGFLGTAKTSIEILACYSCCRQGSTTVASTGPRPMNGSFDVNSWRAKPLILRWMFCYTDICFNVCTSLGFLRLTRCRVSTC